MGVDRGRLTADASRPLDVLQYMHAGFDERQGSPYWHISSRLKASAHWHSTSAPLGVRDG
jgi:hypothetical protein